MKRILFTGDLRFLRRHAALLTAIEKRGFDVVAFEERTRSPIARARYAMTAGRYAATALATRRNRAWPTTLRDLKDGFDRSAAAFRLKSREFDRALARSSERPHAIVHVFGLSSPALAARNVPYAHYLDYTYALGSRGDGAPQITERERRLFLEVERDSYARATALFAMSRLVRDSLVDDYGIDAHKIVVVGAGPNLASFWDGPRTFGSRRLLFNASEFERKGGDLVLAAFELLHVADPTIGLAIVGAALPVAFAGRPGLIEYGQIPAHEMRELYATSDLVLAPARRDPFPGVVIEAMAHGTPPLVRDRDGMPEIVTHDRDGIVLRDADATPERVAAIVRALLDDEPRLAALSHAARATIAERLNWDIVAEKMEPFLASAAPD
jgi:glycosyltransferase involved in cell wall biosynthesis